MQLCKHVPNIGLQVDMYGPLLIATLGHWMLCVLGAVRLRCQSAQRSRANASMQAPSEPSMRSHHLLHKPRKRKTLRPTEQQTTTTAIPSC